jgi:cysteine synthase A
LLTRIGNTPLLPLEFHEEGLVVWAKAEFLNPSGSIKDRFARAVIEEAESSGRLRRDSIVLECSSGNTGIALAMVGAAKGYRVKVLMSRSASVERRHLMHQFGAEVELFDSNGGYGAGIALTRERAAADASVFLPRQFENPLNALDHEEGTAAEILREIPDGRVDAFVAGYGTGGTLTGCGVGLRRHCPWVQVVAMEPAEAALLSGEMPCCHAIEGVAGGYVPPLLRSARIDAVEKVSSADALRMTRRLSREFGLLVGTSSGANVVAALRVAARLGVTAQVATVLCDRAERYYSTALFA